jgi:hypothetical protein
VIYSAGEIYLQYCDCQPLPLFHRGSFLSTLHHRDPELLFAILALTSRFSSHPMSGCSVGDYIEASRDVAMQRVYEGKVELSTLQSLSLLALVDFTSKYDARRESWYTYYSTDGNEHRAGLHSTLAISMAFNSGLAAEYAHPISEIETEERRRCFWSLMLLNRLHGTGIAVLDLTDKEGFPWYPESTGRPNRPDPALMDDPSRQYVLERGVVSCALQLSEIWFKITRYARRRGKPAKLPPWSPQSEYAVIMAQQMESETRMPQIHRFKPAEFSKKTDDELQTNRDYWAPWIFVQFLYHTNLCLLNHPLLSSLRLRNFRSAIPEMFLQSTFDLISSHASWITHLIGMLEAKSFRITDPLLAHCAAIVATIYLQESLVEEDRREKIENFDKCLKFVQGFKEWPHVIRMVSSCVFL